MAESAVELPKVSEMTTEQASKLIPELFECVPTSLRPFIAKGLRLDDAVGQDREAIATLGDRRIDGVPASEFPRFFLRFAGRVAFYHFCLQHLPPEEADAMLGRSCMDPSDVQRTRACRSRILGGSRGPDTSADVIFRIASEEQNQPRGAPRGVPA